MKYCSECGRPYAETHHIIFRSESKALEHCKLNLVDLCIGHHKGTYGVHGSRGAALNRKLKLEFQNNLEILWDKQYLTREEIQEVLQIADKPFNRLLKTLKVKEDKYTREDVIRQCMGGKLIEEGMTWEEILSSEL